MKFTQDFSAQISRLKRALANADAVVVGAGAGLSSAAGFTYSGDRFERYFSDFGQKYGFHDMYSGGFYPYPSPEEFWAYWSRYIFINRYTDPPKPIYQKLFSLVKEKDYFVITTNVDHCFQKAGFDKRRLFYTQGDYGLFQCSKPCCNKTYDNEESIRKMVDGQFEMKIASELIPRCPVCGKPMTMNLRADDKFVQDEGWYAALRRYQSFIAAHSRGKVLFLELGVGYNTPSIIKYPFQRLAAQNGQATYACINLGEALAPDGLKDRVICLNADIEEVLNSL